MPKTLLTVFAFFLFALSTFAQQADKNALQKQREKLRNEIKETEKSLAETKKSAKVNIGQLSLINKKMNLQGKVIENINGEIKNLNDNIYTSQLEINKMKRVLDTLKQEYAKSMVYAYKNRSSYDFVSFIFSANNFNSLSTLPISLLFSGATFLISPINDFTEPFDPINFMRNASAWSFSAEEKLIISSFKFSTCCNKFSIVAKLYYLCF